MTASLHNLLPAAGGEPVEVPAANDATTPSKMFFPIGELKEHGLTFPSGAEYCGFRLTKQGHVFMDFHRTNQVSIREGDNLHTNILKEIMLPPSDDRTHRTPSPSTLSESSASDALSSDQISWKGIGAEQSSQADDSSEVAPASLGSLVLRWKDKSKAIIKKDDPNPDFQKAFDLFQPEQKNMFLKLFQREQDHLLLRRNSQSPEKFEIVPCDKNGTESPGAKPLTLSGQAVAERLQNRDTIVVEDENQKILGHLMENGDAFSDADKRLRDHVNTPTHPSSQEEKSPHIRMFHICQYPELSKKLIAESPFPDTVKDNLRQQIRKRKGEEESLQLPKRARIGRNEVKALQPKGVDSTHDYALRSRETKPMPIRRSQRSGVSKASGRSSGRR